MKPIIITVSRETTPESKKQNRLTKPTFNPQQTDVSAAKPKLPPIPIVMNNKPFNT